MLKLTAATALIQHSLRLENFLSNHHFQWIQFLRKTLTSLGPKNEILPVFWTQLGGIPPYALMGAGWIGAKGGKVGKGGKQLPATVITTFAPISRISPTLEIVRKINPSSADRLHLAHSLQTVTTWEISDFIRQNICFLQIIISPLHLELEDILSRISNGQPLYSQHGKSLQY